MSTSGASWLRWLRAHPRWALLAVLGVTIHGVGFFAVQWPQVEKTPLPPMPTLATRVAPSAVAAPLELLDTAPLFTPSRWHAASAGQPGARLQEASEPFLPYAPQLSLAAAASPVHSPGVADTPAEVLTAPRAGEALRWLGRGENLSPAAEANAAAPPVWAEFRLRSGRLEMRRVDLSPFLPAVPRGWLSPAVYYVQRDKVGLVGPPLRVESSGDPAWDTALEAALRQEAVWLALPVGYWEVWVRP